LTVTEPTATSSYSNPILLALANTSGIVLPFRPSQVSVPASSSSSSSSLITVTQASHGFSTGNSVYYNGSSWLLAKSDGYNTLGIGVIKVTDANTFDVYISGLISGLTGLTSGEYYYVSDAVAGNLTVTEPTSTSSYSNPILFAISTTEGFVLPYRPSQIPISASMPTIGTGLIDFGSAPGTNFVVTNITGQTNILSTSVIQAFMMYDSTASHNQTEHAIVPIKLTCGNIQVGTGFSVYASSEWRLDGTFGVRWIWQ